MGVFTRNRATGLARVLAAQSRTLKELSTATGLPYRRLIRINAGAPTKESERILIGTALSVEPSIIWPLDVAGQGDLSPALLRKLVADALQDDDLCFLVSRAISKLRERYS